MKLNKIKYCKTTLQGESCSAVLLIDNKNIIVKANLGAVELFGYSEKELLHLSILNLFTKSFTSIEKSDFFEKLKSECNQQGTILLQKKSGECINCCYESIANILPGLSLCILNNITEQTMLKEKIALEQMRFEKMFNEAPVAMCILKGKEHVFDSANPNYYKLTNRSKDIIGKTVKEVFPEVKGQGFYEWLDKVYETGQTFSKNETPLILDLQGNGELSQQYINFMYQPFHNENGNVEGIFFFGVNITEQVIARKKIEESEKRYEDLIENLPAAVYTTDAKGRLNLYNTAAIELWGRKPEEGSDVWCGSFKIMDVEGNEIPNELIPMATSIKTGNPMRGLEAIVQRPSGELRYVTPNIALLKNDNGEITGGVNVVIDTTDKRKAEEEIIRLSLIAQKTDNAVVITDKNGKIEWVNEAFSKNTEFSKAEALDKNPAELLYGPNTNPRTINFIYEKLKKHHPFECEILKYKKSGAPFWVEIKGQPVFDANNDLVYYFQIESDITSKKEAFDRLSTAEDQARKFARQLNHVLEEERARIAREIHDEFGQQLNGLKMSLTFLNKLSSGNKQINQLTKSMKQDVGVTLQSLREFATELRPGILDTLGLIESLKWLTSEFEKKLNYSCNFSTNLQNIEFEEDRAINIFRICQEALTNISKHAMATNVAVTFIKFNKEFILTIVDNGIGISSENIANPFAMGILGMRERAKLIKGELQIINKNGTTIQLKISKNDEVFNSR